MDLRIALRSRTAAWLAAAAVATLSWLAATAPAAAQSDGEDELTLSYKEAIRIARTDPNVIAEEQSRGRLEPVTESKPPDTWQVGFKDGADEVVQVLVDDDTGTVKESWTGHQVEWQMARGYEGSFGHKLNAPYVWIPLCLLFFLGLLDWRRPWRVVHLDLLVLLAFSISQIYFNRGEIGVSVPLVYPVLAYVLARALWIGFRGLGRGLSPTAPVMWLAIAAVFLIAFRVALNFADSGTIDVGYAGVIGADRITHLDPIWGLGVFPSDNPFGDTYGPVNYIAYVPFELGMPWSGEWDALPAAHAAAVMFDLAAVAGVFFLGRRLRAGEAGTALGIVLAFAWLAYPYTDYTLQSNSNDTLLAALVIWSLVFFRTPAARGALLAAATLTKFVPLVLAPLYAAGTRGLSLSLLRSKGEGGERRAWLRTALAFVAVFVLASALFLAIPAVDSGLATFWDRTVASQADRSSPFSVFGQADLGPLQTILRIGVVVLGIALAFVPRRRSLAQICALAAAMLIAVQITADHWFYLYIVWFFGPLMAALATGGRDEDSEVDVAATEPAPSPAR